MSNKLFDEISSIREQYFEYPTEDVSPDNVVSRQNVHYLLGAIDALIYLSGTENKNK